MLDIKQDADTATTSTCAHLRLTEGFRQAGADLRHSLPLLRLQVLPYQRLHI